MTSVVRSKRLITTKVTYSTERLPLIKCNLKRTPIPFDDIFISLKRALISPLKGQITGYVLTLRSWYYEEDEAPL